MKLAKKVASFRSKKGSDVVVRSITWDDLDDLLVFANDLIKEDTYIQIHGEEISRDKEIDYLADSIKDVSKGKKLHFVVLVNDKFAGSCEVKRRRERSSHVGDIGISLGKSFRDEGIGTELMQILIAQAKKANFKVLTLTCMGINKRALRVYEKVGFKKVGKTPDAYVFKGKYEDEVLMYFAL